MPEESWDLMISAIREATSSFISTTLNGYTNGEQERQLSPHLWSITTNVVSRPTLQPSQLPYLILDCLYLREHPSHLSFLQSLKTARDIDAARTMLIGFTHPVAHAEWLEGCRSIDGTGTGKEKGFAVKVGEWAGVQRMEDELEDVRQWGGVVRPAWDGMKIGVLRGNVVRYGGEDDEEW